MGNGGTPAGGGRRTTVGTASFGKVQGAARMDYALLMQPYEWVSARQT